MTQEKTPPPEAAQFLDRFRGENGRKLLLEVLGDSSMLGNIPNLGELLNKSELLEIPAEQILITQGASDNCIC
ncbi:MAG: hypothetical protein ACRETP_15795, partial [Steroidobacteraceae bacterium]